MSSLKKQYWRSLNEFHSGWGGGDCWDGSCTAGPESAAEGRQYNCHPNGDPQEDEISRRRWLQLMGASLALAGAGGCRWEKTELLPFAKRSPGRIPGKTEKFATAMELGGSPLGLLVTCVDGRPIKVEGNPKHPYSHGATNAYAQAAILELYDPDRSKNIIQKTPEGDQVRTWDEFAAFAKHHFGELRKTGGEGFAVLSETSSSATLAAMRKRLLDAFPNAKWYDYEPTGYNSAADRTRYALDNAEVIVSIDADLFGTDPAAVRYAHDFAEHRGDAVHGRMCRLYVVESCYTITGAMADHRLAVRNQQLAAFVDQLSHELASFKSRGRHRGNHAAGGFLVALADDIQSHRGRCVLIAGRHQPASVQRQVDNINARFGTPNETFFPAAVDRKELQSQTAAIESLASEIGKGGLKMLLVVGGNPAYNAPADLGIAASLKTVETTIHLGLYRNETARLCTWHLPQAHFLESWGDARAYDGTYSIVQPMIEPLYGGKSAIELLAMLVDAKDAHGEKLVRRQFRKFVAADEAESRWRKTLHDGILSSPAGSQTHLGATNEATSQRPHPAGGSSSTAAPTSTWDGRSLEIIFRPDPKVYDGRFANNGWLQEMPDPMTKLTWDNAAMMSLATAEKLGIAHEDVVRLKFKGREVEAPVYIMPGQADGTVAVSLGYGRPDAGKVGGSTADGIEPVGFDAYKLRTSDAMWFGTRLTIEPTGRKHRFATAHDRYWIDQVGFQGRAERIGELVHELTLEEFQKQQISLPETETKSLWQEPESTTGHRWGMTIDLSKCVGCGACVIACQAENNVPVVGKDRVLRGREMHWLRIDRYFQGHPATAKVVFQPLPCQQCELAPCEQVCPVGATAHSTEGLNDMAYNRCIGVRYCANNCPFKVRRFNFFNYHKDLEDPANEVAKMAYNPQVTVRSRGVMEKCTYCVQRIQAAKIDAKNHRRTTIADGEIQTACQQACPAGAIVFGDLNDKQSAVARQYRSPRRYEMLTELNVKPRTSYLARIRNPNPELEDV